MDIQKLINRENQREITLQAVEAKAKLGMSKLKESYERKMRKIVAYFQMEVRDIKSSCNSMKENIQK
jgi:Cu/Ag efflux pump CusA